MQSARCAPTICPCLFAEHFLGNKLTINLKGIFIQLEKCNVTDRDLILSSFNACITM